MSDEAQLDGQPWSVVFRKSKTVGDNSWHYGPHLVAVRRPYHHMVANELDTMATRRGGGYAGSFMDTPFVWTTQYGSAVQNLGWQPGIWVDDMELLLVLCDRLGLQRPHPGAHGADGMK
ncbi:MAG: hypothetical protein L6Q80_08060 [Dehalococcoidia bacterium]|nr:hypothetical protein [Dehalococcoidia bacterium]RIL02079.1 MAG: hypothetical protein DCC78_08375 [bacterium]